MPSKTILYIGLGNLGFPIARNLTDDGYRMRIFDVRRDSDRVRDLESRGATFSDPRQALEEGVDAILTILPDSETVLDTFLGADGLINHLKPGTLCIEMTSGFPDATIRLGEEVASRGARIVDAPICNGAVPGAYARRLVHLVGGTERDFAEAKPLLDRSARGVFHVGPLGTGHAMKTVNNTVQATCVAAVMEGLAQIKAWGVDLDRAIEVFRECSINQNAFERAPEILARPFEAEASFRLALMRKDMRYAARLAADLGVPHPVADAAHTVFLHAERAGLGDRDATQGAAWAYGLKGAATD
jgi:3-hydroxyisobutyrate dehydrogenase-like beta-hydroxyacid dehydrogenase